MLRRRLDERGATVAEETQLCLDRFCDLFERPQPAWRRVWQLLGLGIPAIDLPRRILYYLCVSVLPGQQTITLPEGSAKIKAA